MLSGSLCGWGDPADPQFDLAVFLLVPTEVRLTRLRVELLMRHQGEVLTRASLRQRLWRNDGIDNLVNLVDVHISHLGKKIDREPLESLIHTIRGRGYRLGLDH